VQHRQQYLALCHQLQHSGTLTQFHYNADDIIKQADIMLLLQTSIQQVLSSIPGHDTNYPDWGLMSFFLVTQAIDRIES